MDARRVPSLRAVEVKTAGVALYACALRGGAAYFLAFLAGDFLTAVAFFLGAVFFLGAAFLGDFLAAVFLGAVFLTALALGLTGAGDIVSLTTATGLRVEARGIVYVIRVSVEEKNSKTQKAQKGP